MHFALMGFFYGQLFNIDLLDGPERPALLNYELGLRDLVKDSKTAPT